MTEIFRVSERRLFEGWFVSATILFLVTTSLSGPIRYLLSGQNLSFLIYIPQAILMLVLASYPLITLRLNKTLVLVLFLLSISAGLAILQIGYLSQVLFGLYIFLPFIFGIAAYPYFFSRVGQIKLYLIPLFWIVVVGVVLDVWVEYPWSGFEYVLSGIEIEGSRVWTTIGIQRLAGFSRASFAAASEILLLALFSLFLVRNNFVRGVTWIAAGAGIALTTSKSLTIVYVIVTMFFLFRKLLPQRAWFWLQAGLLTLVILAPLTSYIVKIDASFDSRLQTFLFASFFDRISSLWPRIFAFISSEGNAIFGRGVGGIGTAQVYFEPEKYLPGDNLFLYLYAIFGLLSVFLLVGFVWGARKLKLNQVPVDLFIYTVILSTLGFGLTANVVESPYFSFFVGISIAHLIRYRSQPARLPTGHPAENSQISNPPHTHVTHCS